MILVGVAVLVAPSRVRAAGCSENGDCQGSNPPGCTDAACLDRCPDATSPGCGGGGGGAALVDSCAAGKVSDWTRIRWANCVGFDSSGKYLDQAYIGNNVRSPYGCSVNRGEYGGWQYGGWQQHGTCCLPTAPCKKYRKAHAATNSVVQPFNFMRRANKTDEVAVNPIHKRDCHKR